MTEQTFYQELDFAKVQHGTYPPVLRDRARWMGKEDGGKRAFNPLGEPPEGKNKWQWTAEENHSALDEIREIREMDPRLDSNVAAYIFEEDSRLILVDGDDVVDPELGLHPKAAELLDRVLTPGYASISQSYHGSHIPAKAPNGLPGGAGKYVVELDDEPWGENDSPPKLEFFDRRQITHETGEQPVGTPDTLADLKHDALEAVVEEYTEEGVKEESDGDWEPSVPDDYEPTATSADETTHDWNDVTYAVDNITARDIRSYIHENGPDSNGWINFIPNYRPTDSGTSAQFHPEQNVFKDWDKDYVFGPDVYMAIEGGFMNSPSDQYPQGKDWSDFLQYLRNCGLGIPQYEAADGGEDGGEYLDLLNHPLFINANPTARRRMAKKRGIEYPTTEVVRERTEQKVLENIEQGRNRALTPPTASGKTHVSSSTEFTADEYETGDQPVVRFAKTRDARDDGAGMSDDAGIDNYTLKGRKETCEVCAGHHDPGNENGNPGLTIDGTPISDWIDHLCDDLGFGIHMVHDWAEEELGHALPCEWREGEDENATCPSKTRFEGIPRDDDGNPTHDVIHATAPFSHVPGLRLRTNVIFDEKPDFSLDVGGGVMQDAINSHVRWSDAPFDTYNELYRASTEGKVPGGQADLHGNEALRRWDAQEIIVPALRSATDGDLLDYVDVNTALNYALGKDRDYDEGYETEEIVEMVRGLTDFQLYSSVDCEEFIEKALSKDPPISWFRENRVHSLAPAFAHCLWNAEDAAGPFISGKCDYHPPRYDADANDEDGWNVEEVRVIFNTEVGVPHKAHASPKFSTARSVTCLDAHAQDEDPMWRLNVWDGIETENILTQQERTLYRRYERGLQTVQVGDKLNPVTSPEYVGRDEHGNRTALSKRIRTATASIRDEWGERFRTGLTSKSANPTLREAMEDAGVADPETMTYGSEESRNDFEGEEAGIVVGAIDPGDGHIIETLALLGLDARPVMNDCERCDGQGHKKGEHCTACDGSGVHRERGRTFAGPDRHHAQKVLKTVREHHTAQSIGRYARDAESDSGATVYVMTNAAPEGMIDVQSPGVEWTATENQRAVLRAVRDADGSISTAEVEQQTGLTRSAVNATLKKARERGLVDCHGGGGAHGAFLYEAETGVCVDGSVELSEPASAAYRECSMWSLSIRAFIDRAANLEPDERRDDHPQVSLGTWPRLSGPPSAD